MTKEINQEDFLTEYLKSKEGWEVFKPLPKADGSFLRQESSNKILDIEVFKIDDLYNCIITNNEFQSFRVIADFDFPATYQEFKTLMDIFLKTGD
jgi:hypothetical protein